jgi:hypothetical protein
MQAQDHLLRKSLSQSSVSAYKSSFAAYRAFIWHHFGPSANPLPPSLHHLSAFIAHCFLKQLAASTTRTLVSSLSFTFQLSGYQDISQHFIIRKMLVGFKKCKPSSEARLPITPPILIRLIEALRHTTSSFFTRRLLTAMFVLAFCAFLRIGEITKTPGSANHFLLRQHISIQGDLTQQGIIDVHLPHFKHSKTNITTLRLSRNRNTPTICPCAALLQDLQVRKHASPSEPLFSFMDGAPVSKHFFTQNLRAALAFCHLDLHRYQSHSFRIGAATTAAASGFSGLQIQNMGRTWAGPHLCKSPSSPWTLSVI